MLFFNKKAIINEQGFTLLEAMVTLGIITIMSAAYITNYRSTNQKIILDQTASNLVSELRQAQNMSMNVKLFNNSIPEGGYGILINNTVPASYTVYADCNANSHVYDNSSLCGSTGNQSEKVLDRVLDSSITIIPVVDISFQPPNPIVWINGATAAAFVDIYLRYGSNVNGKKITINRLTGQISVSEHAF